MPPPFFTWISVQSSAAPSRVRPQMPSWPSPNANVPPPFDSLTPPVSGLLQPTLTRFAFEKFVPAKGTGGEDQRVLPRQRVDRRGVALEERARDQVTPGADDVLAVQLLGADRAAREIDVVVVAHGSILSQRRGGGRWRRSSPSTPALHSESRPPMDRPAPIRTLDVRGQGAPWTPSRRQRNSTRHWPTCDQTTPRDSPNRSTITRRWYAACSRAGRSASSSAHAAGSSRQNDRTSMPDSEAHCSGRCSRAYRFANTARRPSATCWYPAPSPSTEFTSDRATYRGTDRSPLETFPQS